MGKGSGAAGDERIVDGCERVDVDVGEALNDGVEEVDRSGEVVNGGVDELVGAEELAMVEYEEPMKKTTKKVTTVLIGDLPEKRKITPSIPVTTHFTEGKKRKNQDDLKIRRRRIQRIRKRGEQEEEGREEEGRKEERREKEGEKKNVEKKKIEKETQKKKMNALVFSSLRQHF